MGNKSSERRFGRFFGLYFLVIILGSLIGSALGLTAGLIGFFVMIVINMLSLGLGIYLHNKALKSDKENNIPITLFGNMFLPWPKAAIALSMLFLFELAIYIPVVAYSFYPCDGLDVIRKISGCVSRIPHNSLVTDIAFSKDGKTFATSEFNGPVRVWSYPDLTLLNSLGNNRSLDTNLALSSDGEMIAMCSYNDTTSILETRTGKVLRTLIKNNDEFCDILFTPDDKLVISTSSGSKIQTWDVATGNLVNSTSQDNLNDLELSNDGQLLATGSGGGLINIRHVPDNTILTTIQQPYLSMAFSQDGKYLLTALLDMENLKNRSEGSVSTINVWNVKTGKIDHTITLQGSWVKYIATSKNSNMFAIGDSLCGVTSRNLLYDKPCVYFGQTLDDKQPKSLKIPDEIWSLAFSPTDGKILVGTDKNLYIWQVP